MKIIYKPRRTGKTHELIKLSHENQIPIVCMWTTKRYIIDLAKKLNLQIPKPLEINEAKEQKLPKIYIDDAEIVFRYVFGSEVEAITLSDESDEDDVVD